VRLNRGKKPLLLLSGESIQKETVRWLWPDHIPLGTLVSFEGDIGTQKSAIAKDWAARVTAGLPFPECDAPALGPSAVIYFTSEDSAGNVRDLVEIHGGDLSRLKVYDAQDAEPLDLLERLDDLEDTINKLRCPLVVVDALNSFVAGDISTDAKARRTMTGRLQSLAKRTGACIVAIRNYSRIAVGPSSARALGAISLSHVSRCCLHVEEGEPDSNQNLREGEERRFRLVFERVSNAPLPRPIPFQLKNLSTCREDRHRRRIEWTDCGKLRRALGGKVAEKGSAESVPTILPFQTAGA